MPPKIILAIIQALTTFVQVLDRCRFGAVMLMLILVMVIAGTLMALPYLPAVLA
jgi:predicted membrane channel-forming protein YqfA (hemolysin III family)